MENIDIYIMPSYSEAFGLAMVEAAMQHKAIACSDIPSFREIFSKNEAGSFQLDNVDSMESCLRKIYENLEDYKRRAYISAMNKYNASVMARNYLSFYKEKLSKMSPPRIEIFYS